MNQLQEMNINGGHDMSANESSEPAYQMEHANNFELPDDDEECY